MRLETSASAFCSSSFCFCAAAAAAAAVGPGAEPAALLIVTGVRGSERERGRDLFWADGFGPSVGQRESGLPELGRFHGLNGGGLVGWAWETAYGRGQQIHQGHG